MRDGCVCGAGPDQSAEAELHELAARVIAEVEARMQAGDDPSTAIAEILTALPLFHTLAPEEAAGRLRTAGAEARRRR